MEILGEIGTGSNTAVKALECILSNKQHENQCCLIIAAISLIRIGSGDLRITAIKHLINCLQSSQLGIARDAAISLEQVDFSKLDIAIFDETISALTKRLERNSVFDFYSFERAFIAKALSKIAPRNHPSNQYAINVLTEQLRLSHSTIEAGIAAQFLKEAGFDSSEEVNTALKDSQDTFGNDLTYRLADLGLELGSNVINTVKALIDLMCSDEEQPTREQAAWCLEVILLNKQFAPQSYLFASVVNSLKACLKKLLERNNHRFYEISFGLQDPLTSCYNLLWYFSQTLLYPEFYQA